MAKKRKREKDILSKAVCAGVTPDNKVGLKKLKADTGLSYAQLIRDALALAYPKYFKL